MCEELRRRTAGCVYKVGHEHVEREQDYMSTTSEREGEERKGVCWCEDDVDFVFEAST